uniref:PDZ domain-containing protein n=2 Tax=Photinus pyralis TaxID=7054 RepID=A0A1Y1MMJ7_PHOPY
MLDHTSIEINGSLRRNLEELLKLMLVIWCKENQALKLVAGKPNDADKSIIIQRRGGQFGFRMHGSRPVLISAIEPETPAESSGLEVGDAIVAINSINVLDKSHSEAIEIVRSAGDTVTLEVLSTCTVLNPDKIEENDDEEDSLYCGYLWKLAGYASGLPSDKWLRRWFTIKTDNCLYYYKTDSDDHPVGAVMLMNYEVAKDCENHDQTFRFDLRKDDAPTLHLAADTQQGADRWIEALVQTVDRCQLQDRRVEQVKWNQLLEPGAIISPDCFGYLMRLGHTSSNRRYCILKDGCLYFYYDIHSQNAFGVVCLYGYTVHESTDQSINFAFEVLPGDLGQKPLYFYTETEQDQKRWITAIEYSIKQSQCLQMK